MNDKKLGLRGLGPNSVQNNHNVTVFTVPIGYPYVTYSSYLFSKSVKTMCVSADKGPEPSPPASGQWQYNNNLHNSQTCINI